MLSNATQDEKGSSDIESLETGWVKGNPEAEIEVVEFSGFQCEACAREASNIRGLVDLNQDFVKLVYKHFPFTEIHANGLEAAIASEIAGEEGKFWEMHDLLFLGQDEWSKSPEARVIFANYAEEVGLNREEFIKAYEDPKYEERVRNDITEGQALGVESTPAIFVNGSRVKIEELSTVISRLIGIE